MNNWLRATRPLFRRGITAAAGLTLIATLTATVSAPATATQTAPGTHAPATGSVAIDTNSRESVRRAFFDVYKPASEVPVGWDGSVDGCVAGSPTSEALDAAETTWNYYRAMAGSGPIALDNSLNERAQGVTLITEANGTLNHYPAPSSRCYTGRAATDSAQASLARGARTIGGHLDAFIDDFGSDNGPVGHRRQLLAPAVAYGGVGGTSNAASTLLGSTTSGDDDALIAWPSAGYFPSPLMPVSNRWSLQSSGLSQWDLSDATVTISEPGGRAAASQVTYTSSTVVVFTPTLPGSPGPEPTYTVTVSDIVGLDGNVTTYRYTITPFDPATDPPSTEGEVIWSTQPRVSGDVVVGSTLTVDSGVFSPRAENPAAEQISYSWFRQGDTTLLTKGDTYTPTSDDLGHPLVARVHIAVYGNSPEPDAVGATATVTAPVSAATDPPTNTEPPTITGTPSVGEQLTAGPGSWTGATSYGYQWYREASPIAGATGRRYTLTASDAGKSLRINVTATADDGSVSQAFSDPFGPVDAAPPAPSPLSQPSLRGDARVDGRLLIDPGQWNVDLGDPGTTVTYQWFRGPQATGHTARFYQPQAGDLNKTISATVTVTRNGQSATAETGAQTITRGLAARPDAKPRHRGTLRVGKTLKGKAPTWTPEPTSDGLRIRYQWLRNGKVVKSMTGLRYQLTRADRGKRITFRVTAVWKGHHTRAVTSSPRGRIR